MADNATERPLHEESFRVFMLTGGGRERSICSDAALRGGGAGVLIDDPNDAGIVA